MKETLELKKEIDRINRELASYRVAAMHLGEHMAEIARLNQELSRSRREMEVILGTSSDAMRLIDREFNIIRINKAMELLCGFKSEEIVGEKCFNYLKTEAYHTESCLINQVLSQNCRVKKELSVRIDGKDRFFIVAASPLRDETGEIMAILEDFVEITELKNAQKSLDLQRRQLLSIFDSIDEPVYVSDPDTYEILYINKVLKGLIGDTVGKKCYEAFQNLDSPCPFCTNNKIFGKNLGKTYVWEHFNQRVGKWYHCIDRAIQWPDGRWVRYEMGMDITERKKIRNDLLRFQKLESLSLLAGGIAHDFNNILTSILGHISLATMLLDPEDEAYEMLSEIEKSSIFARELTQQLLTYAKGEHLVTEVTDILELLRESASFTLRGSNVSCKFIKPKEIWHVTVDRARMSQVINNLIINARQAMPGGGVVEIAVDNIEIEADSLLPLKEGKYVKISLKDQGMGIPEQHLQQIFDPYFTTKQKGSGLGLATVYSTIKKHGGYITAESEMGKGARFSFFLPASAGKIKVRKEKKCDFKVSKGRILLMDDDLSVLKVSGRLLEHIGYEVEVSLEGAQALRKYEDSKTGGKPFDLVIMDLTIPGGMGGRQAIKELLEMDPNARVIVSSGYSDDDVMANYRNYGFIGAVAKPYSFNELIDIVNGIILNGEN